MAAFACLTGSARPDRDGNYEPCPGYPCDACIKEKTMDEISVTVNVPEGLPAPRVTLIFEPETTAEFDAIIEAAGGMAAWTHAGSFAFVIIDGVSVHLHEPKDAPRPAPVSTFMADFRARLNDACEARKRVEQMT